MQLIMLHSALLRKKSVLINIIAQITTIIKWAELNIVLPQVNANVHYL